MSIKRTMTYDSHDSLTPLICLVHFQPTQPLYATQLSFTEVHHAKNSPGRRTVSVSEGEDPSFASHPIHDGSSYESASIINYEIPTA